MKFLIMTVWLAIVQTGPPVPRQASNSPASTRGNNQKQTQAKKTPTNPPSPDIHQNQPETTNGNRGEQANKNAENSISISKLPPVTVLPAKRDWFDRLYWGFGALLAVTGILQIILLFKTVRIYDQQREQMVQAGKQTERIIAQMKDTAVRELRAYIGVSKVRLNLSEPTIPIGIVELQNFGQTPAYKVRQHIGIAIYPHPLAVTLPGVNSPLSSVAVMSPGVKHGSLVPLKKPIPPTMTIGTPAITVYVFGGVIYEDAFGEERHTAYRFIYGGPEGVNHIRENGILFGVMNPDTSGNEAD